MSIFRKKSKLELEQIRYVKSKKHLSDKIKNTNSESKKEFLEDKLSINKVRHEATMDQIRKDMYNN